MPLLSDADLLILRAGPIGHCDQCAAQTWNNYCREHDEFFEDGHYEPCPKWSPHSGHRKY